MDLRHGMHLHKSAVCRHSMRSRLPLLVSLELDAATPSFLRTRSRGSTAVGETGGTKKDIVLPVECRKGNSCSTCSEDKASLSYMRIACRIETRRAARVLHRIRDHAISVKTALRVKEANGNCTSAVSLGVVIARSYRE